MAHLRRQGARQSTPPIEVPAASAPVRFPARASGRVAAFHGRTAIFADCGMGKTPMQLVRAREVARKARKPVLIIAALRSRRRPSTRRSSLRD